jgi:D-amino-acid dehydrogenase
LAGWGVKFLQNSTAAPFERNTLKNLRRALCSLKVLQALRQETGIEYGCAAPGSLRIFRDPAALERGAAAAQRLSSEGLSFRRLSAAETVELEPALAPIAKLLSGALHYGADETGDAYRFCVALAEHLRRQGVEFSFRTQVTSLEMRSGQVTAALSDQTRFTADQYVVAADSYSTPLLRHIGVPLPVRPAKGYSVTLDRPPGESSLRIPIVDDHFHAVVVPLDGAIRVAGTAEFGGYDLTLRPARIRNLLNFLQQVLPDASFDPAAVRPWCGLRTMSADGVPVIGRTPLSNLFVNTGHGHLGWTMQRGLLNCSRT